MKTINLPRSIWFVFIISLCYWAFLSLKSFSADAIGYKDLGLIFYHQGLIGYVSSGLHREPLYPLLCALAVTIENLTGFGFTPIMALFSILILLATQILMYIILRKLNIRSWICVLTLLYWAVSPAINNSAFNILIFCEIITYPLILAAILASYSGWNAIKQDDHDKALGYGALTGLLFVAITLVKAAFECICPAFLFVFLAASVYKKKISLSLVCFLSAAGILFSIPVISYKCLNKIYNGNFAIADRGPKTFYGNVDHRLKPLTPRKYFASFADVAGDDLCTKFFRPAECIFWDFQISDDLGARKFDELTGTGLPPQKVTDELLRLSKQRAIKNLPQYTLMSITQSLRAYFWEGRTDFMSFRLLIAVITFMAVLYCFFSLQRLPDLMLHILGVLFFFIFFYAFFDILPRHMLPIVPLYLICISYGLQSFLKKMHDH